MMHPSRTGMATSVALLLSLACAATGCASGGATSGERLRFATAAEPDCLDPQVSADDATALIGRNIFDSLVSLDRNGTFRPWLAEHWTVSPDRKKYTFHLRKGVTFHDGTPFDAAAVKATLDHAVDPKTRSKYARNLLDGYTGTTVVDPATAEVRLSRPEAGFLEALSTPYLGIQSPKALHDAPQSRCTAPVGSGPFRFVSWKSHNSIELAKNPRYAWGPATAVNKGAAKLTALTFSFISEDSVRYGALSSGQVDVADEIPPTDVKALQAQGRSRLLRAQPPGLVYSLFLNAVHGPLADDKVRLALRDALDIGGLVKSVYLGQYSRAWSPLSPTTTYYDASLTNAWPPDVATANRLLDQAGWSSRDSAGYRTKDGKRLKLRWPGRAGAIHDQREILNQGIQAQAKAVGIEIDLAEQDPGAYAKDILSTNLDLFATNWPRADADILRHFFGSRGPLQGGGNVIRVPDAPLIHGLDEAAASSDPAVRKRDYAEAQQHLVNTGLVIPVYIPETLVGMSSGVRGLTLDAHTLPVFVDAERTG